MGTIAEVKETWQESGGWETSDGIKGSVNFNRTFMVTVDNTGGNVRPGDVLNHVDIPKKNDSHPWNFYFRCRSSTAERLSPILFKVTSTYKSESPDLGGDNDEESNPLNQPPDVSYSTIQSEEEVDEDIDGNALATDNDEPYVGITIPVADLQITVAKNLAAFDPTSIYAFVNTVNSTSFMGFAAGVVRLNDLSAQIQYAADFAYWRVTAQFQCRYPIKTTAARAWWKRIAHAGYLVRNATTLEVVEATDANGERVSSPVYLDSGGTKKAEGEAPDYVEFQVFRETNFNTLGLGV